MSVHFMSRSNEWETPQDLFDELNREFDFTLDVAATEQNTKCARFYDRAQDGLAQPWDGVCWCNPPYGREIAKWVKRAAEASSTVVMLLPARTDTRWFHDYIYGKAEIRFIRGRLRFSGATVNAPFPSMIVIFRRDMPMTNGNRIRAMADEELAELLRDAYDAGSDDAEKWYMGDGHTFSFIWDQEWLQQEAREE